ncbi:DotA/TraY family protein [Acidithiobacillus ferrooxidans F221]|nr:DotA/TraY family protein [Acidithiobacillus ferrooxidans F221]
MTMPNISLIPSSGDISVQMISSLLGNGWWKFVSGAAPSGPGSILGQLFSVIDIALLMYVSAIMMYTAVVGGLATAREGVPLGKRYHSVWAPIRGPATWFMLFPLPWAKGLAMIQVILLVAVYWGIGVADDVWSTFVQEVPKYGGMLIPYQGNMQKEQAFVEKALIDTTAQQYIIKNGNHPMTAHWLWVGDTYSGTWVYGMSAGGGTAGIQYGLGTISFKCSSDMSSTDAPSGSWLGNLWGDTVQTVKDAFSAVTGATVTTAQDTQACLDEKANVGMLMDNLQPYADKIVSMNAQSNGKAPSAAELSSLVSMYQNLQGEAYTAASQYGGAQYTQQLQKFANTSSNLGWASSAYYWWTLSNVNAKAQAQIKSLHARVTLPSESAMARNVGQFYRPYIHAVKGLIELYQAEQNQSNQQQAQAVNVATVGAGTSSSGDSWAGTRLMEMPMLFTSGDPLSNVASFGAKVQHWGEGLMAVGVGTKIVVYGAKAVGAIAGSATDEVDGPTGTVGGGILGGMVGKAIVGGLKAAALPLGKLAFVVGAFMVGEGAVLHYVFPAIPGIIMMIAIVGWLFLVVELMVASVLWAAAHVYAEGEGFAPPQAQYGYSAAIGIIARPLLLTVGFIFAFFIMDIGGWFLGEALQAFLAGMGGTQVGIIGFCSMLAVIIGAEFLFIKTVLKLITHLADRAPQWIGGHSGQGLGTEEVAGGATLAVAGAGGVVGKYAGKVGGMYGENKRKRDDEAGGSGNGGFEAEPPQKVVAQGLNAGNAASTGVEKTTGEDGTAQ